VHIDEDSIIFDALLNQTNTASTKGSNKFYRMQLLHDGAQDFRVWTRWGRVGYEGSHSLLGDGTLAGAMREFDKKFRDKSGLPWTQRFEAAKTKKYVFLERDYEPDASQDAAKDTSPKEDSEEFEMEESTLLDPIQRLMEMIFNKGFMYDTMQALDYDAEKLPLGKLSKRTITQAYQTLKVIQ
jgi:poly [ADP-ribose] polymerase